MPDGEVVLRPGSGPVHIPTSPAEFSRGWKPPSIALCLPWERRKGQRGGGCGEARPTCTATCELSEHR